MPEYVQSRIQDNSLESLREAVLLSPTNGVAFAKLAARVLQQGNQENPDPGETLQHLGEADFYSRYAVKLAPNDPEVARIRAEIQSKLPKR